MKLWPAAGWSGLRGKHKRATTCCKGAAGGRLAGRGSCWLSERLDGAPGSPHRAASGGLERAARSVADNRLPAGRPAGQATRWSRPRLGKAEGHLLPAASVICNNITLAGRQVGPSSGVHWSPLQVAPPPGSSPVVSTTCWHRVAALVGAAQLRLGARRDQMGSISRVGQRSAEGLDCARC